MVEFSDLAYVHSAPEDTFRLLADSRAFIAHSRAFRFGETPGGPFVAEGDRFDVDWLLALVPTRMEFVVVSCVPAELLALKGRGRGVSLDYSFSLRPSGPGTRIHLASRLDLSGWHRMTSPLLQTRFGDDGSAMLAQWQRTLNEHFRSKRLSTRSSSPRDEVTVF